MNARQVVSQAMYARCVAWAHAIDDAVRARCSGVTSHGIDLARQVDAKIGEVVVAMALDLDPETALYWDGPDPGWDMIWRGIKIDVKATGYDRCYLPWPIAKNGRYQRAPFDMLALVKVEDREGFVTGWRSKAGFFRDKQVEGHPLTPGTWCVHQRTLLSFDRLIEAMPC